MKHKPEEGPLADRSSSASILYVDDEEDLVDFMASELEMAGFIVHRAYGGNEAITLASRHHIDAVISDARMPLGDGFLLLRHVREVSRTKPFVLILTGSDLSEEVEAFDLGADAIFAKPFEVDEVLLRVKQLLDPSALIQPAPVASPGTPTMQLQFSSFKVAVDGKQFNVGRGGMFVQLLGPLPRIGQELDFLVRFDDQATSPLAGRAICRWYRNQEGVLPRGAGYEFLRMDESSHQVLQKLLDDYPRTAFIPKT